MKRRNYKEEEDQELEYDYLSKPITENPDYSSFKEYIVPKEADYFGQDLVTTIKGAKTAFMSGQNALEGKINKAKDFFYNEKIKSLEKLVENTNRERVFGLDNVTIDEKVIGYEKNIKDFKIKIEENDKQQKFVKANYKNFKLEMDKIVKSYNNPVNKVILGELGLNMLEMFSDPIKASLFMSVHSVAPIVGAQAKVSPLASEYVADLIEGTALDYIDKLIMGTDKNLSSSLETGAKESLFGLGFGLISKTIKGRGTEVLYEEVPKNIYKNIIDNGKEQAKMNKTTKAKSTNGILNNKINEANITGNYTTKEQVNSLLGVRNENFKVTDEITDLDSYVDNLYKMEELNVNTDSGTKIIDPNLETIANKVLGDFDAKKQDIKKTESGAKKLIKEKKIQKIEDKLDLLERMDDKKEEIKIEEEKLSNLGVVKKEETNIKGLESLGEYDKINAEDKIGQSTLIDDTKGSITHKEIKTSKTDSKSVRARGTAVSNKIKLNENKLEILKQDIKDVRRLRSYAEKDSPIWKEKDVELDGLIKQRKKLNRELNKDDKLLKDLFKESTNEIITKTKTKEDLNEMLMDKIRNNAPQKEIDEINNKLDKIEKKEMKEVKKINNDIAKELGEDVEDVEGLDDIISELLDLEAEEFKYDPMIDPFDIKEDNFKGLEESLSSFVDKIKFEEVRKEYDNYLVGKKSEDLFNYIEKTEQRTKKPLTPKDSEKLAMDYFKSRILNQYKNHLTKSKTEVEDFMTFKRVDGNIVDPKKILTESHLNGNKKTLTKLALGIELDKKETLNVSEYKEFLKNLKELTTELFEGREDLTYEDAINSLTFDRTQIFRDGSKSWIKAIDSDGNLDLGKIDMKMWEEVKATFIKKNKDFLSEIEMDKILNRLKIGWTRPDSGFKGTSVHGFDDIVNMKFISKEQQTELVKRYMSNSNVFFDKVYSKVPSALALTETLGYDSKKNLDSIFQLGEQGDYSTKLYSKLYETSVNSKTTQKSVKGQIDSSMDEILGFSTKFTPNLFDKSVRHIAKVSTITLGLLEPLTELAVQFNKVNSLAPERTVKTLYKTVKDTVQAYTGLKSFSKDPRISKYMKDHIGSVQGIYVDLLSSGFNDISGSKALQLEEATLSKKMYGKSMNFVSKLNFIKGIDNVGDKLSILRFNDLMNDMYDKVGYDKIMSDVKYDYLASKIEMFGITKEMFDKMGEVKYDRNGIKIFEDSTNLTVDEKKLAEEFMNWGFNEVAYTKPDSTFSSAINNIEDPRTRGMIELQLFFKKTMFSKLLDLQKISVQHNTYAGLGKNFNYSNLSHLGRMGFGISMYLLAMEGNNELEEIYYGYDPSLKDTPFLQFMNDWGFYTILDASGISRSISKVAGAKNISTGIEGLSEMTVGKFPVRTAKRLFGKTKKSGKSGMKRGGKIGRKK